jgi:hypothetical protein
MLDEYEKELVKEILIEIQASQMQTDVAVLDPTKSEICRHISKKSLERAISVAKILLKDKNG